MYIKNGVKSRDIVFISKKNKILGKNEKQSNLPVEP